MAFLLHPRPSTHSSTPFSLSPGPRPLGPLSGPQPELELRQVLQVRFTIVVEHSEAVMFVTESGSKRRDVPVPSSSTFYASYFPFRGLFLSLSLSFSLALRHLSLFVSCVYNPLLSTNHIHSREEVALRNRSAYGFQEGEVSPSRVYNTFDKSYTSQIGKIPKITPLGAGYLKMTMTDTLKVQERRW